MSKVCFLFSFCSSSYSCDMECFCLSMIKSSSAILGFASCTAFDTWSRGRFIFIYIKTIAVIYTFLLWRRHYVGNFPFYDWFIFVFKNRFGIGHTSEQHPAAKWLEQTLLLIDILKFPPLFKIFFHVCMSFFDRGLCQRSMPI